MKIPFTKMHGAGNDYVYVNGFALQIPDPAALARVVSLRRKGIGSDGLILVQPSSVAAVRMEMYNADGSRGEMCGNGIRCVARLHYERAAQSRNPPNRIVIETDCGPKTVELKLDGGRVIEATVDMGEPILEGREIPVAADGRIVDYPLEVGGRAWRISAASMGNPHCVVFVDDEAVFALEDSEFARVGRQFEHHPFFPRRVNTEFILPLSRDRLRMRVWERGSGETLACGTGACASLVAAVLTGRTERRAMLELRGGKLEIEWRERGESANHVMMTGEAVEVFSGEVDVGDGELVPVVA